jgi:hypothetical protein
MNKTPDPMQATKTGNPDTHQQISDLQLFLKQKPAAVFMSSYHYTQRSLHDMQNQYLLDNNKKKF